MTRNYRRTLVVRWSRRDRLAALVVAVTVGFLVGTALLVVAGGAQTAALFAATLVTVPVAFVTLDTFHYPATTAESEFAATGFTSTNVPGQWATHHPPAQIASQYFEGGGNRWMAREWMVGGDPPGCPVLSQDSWTTHGAHFFPAAPQTISPGDYGVFLADRNVVYANTGRDPLVLSGPRDTEIGAPCGPPKDAQQDAAI